MTETAAPHVLKKPIGVYILAFLFLLAPLGNIIISFAGSGVQNWYEPSVFMSFLQTIPKLEWLWLGLLFVSGALLFRPHKLSWSLAIFTLILILFINVFRMYSAEVNSIDIRYLKVFSILALLCTIGVLVISFYFRFPYLDRRADWVKNIQRFNFVTPVKINSIEGFTESISKTGCKVKLSQSLKVATGDSIQIFLTEIYNQSVSCIVVENQGGLLRLEFATTDETFKTTLKSWLSQKEST